jgi:dolichol-phosphate mannosyltransferase
MRAKNGITKSLTIILPTLNERENIIPLIKSIVNNVNPAEILIVDENSPDGTAIVADIHKYDDTKITVLVNHTKLGLSKSLAKGLNNVKTSYVGWMDADFSHPPELLPVMWKKLQKNDLIVASWLLPKCKDNRPIFISLYSRFINKFCQIMFGNQITAYTSGYILTRTKLIKNYKLKGFYGEYCIALLTELKSIGKRILEVPFDCQPRKLGESKTTINPVKFIYFGLIYLKLILTLKFEALLSFRVRPGGRNLQDKYMNLKIFKIILAGFVLGTLLYTISLYRYNAAQIFYYDFGIFARIIWKLSRFLPPTINHISLGNINFLGDHFNPSLILLVPLFWLTQNIKVLLYEQALAIGFTVIIIYLISRRENLNRFTAGIVTFCFLIFAGTLNPLVTDWHPESTAGLILLIFYWLFSYQKKIIPILISWIIFLGFKESNGIPLTALLIVFFVRYPEKRKLSIILAILSMFWFKITTSIIIPAFSHSSYLYYPKLPQTIWELIQNITPQKLKLIHLAMVSFSYIPLLSPLWLIPVIEELSIRVIPISSSIQVFDLGFHYNVFLGIFITLGIISIFRKINLYFPKQQKLSLITCILLIFFSLYTAKKLTNSPIYFFSNFVFWKQFNQSNIFFSDIKRIPVKGSVMSQNNILPHLIARNEDVYLLNINYTTQNPNIIVLDLTPNQNLNDYYPLNMKQIETIKFQLINNPNYQRLATDNFDFYIFKHL